MGTPKNYSIDRFFRSGLKLPHLRILVSLADLGQVTRVAAAFHVTQPAISKQIGEIEQALGVPIARRVGNAVELTDIGTMFAARGREVLRQIELARRDVIALSTGTAGHVSFGAVVTIPEPLLVHAIELFVRRAPDASLSFVEATLDKLIKMTDDGHLDLALGRNRMANGQGLLNHETLHREPFVFVVGATHPLGKVDLPVGWDDVRLARWIAPLRGSPAFATLAEALAAHGIVLGLGTIESSSLALNVSLLIGGGFVSILPLSIARHHASRGRMRILPLAPLEPLGEVVLYWRADTSTPAANLFSECLRESALELLENNRG